MAASTEAERLAAELTDARLGEIKARAREIKVDHDLALELWASGAHTPRLLSVLIMDRKRLTQGAIDDLASDMMEYEDRERDQLADWFLANQLMKDRKLVTLMETWERSPSPIQRRLFWYHQARLRWTGRTPPGNTRALLASLENDLADAEPVVQWAMNFCACQIGVHEPEFRQRCLDLGERLGLYRDEVVPRNCVPSYLPEFVRIEVAKRGAGQVP